MREVLENLRAGAPAPATRTEMRDWLGRSKSEAQITATLAKLNGLRLAEQVKPQGDHGRGRPAELWRVTSVFRSSPSFMSSGAPTASASSSERVPPTTTTKGTTELEEDAAAEIAWLEELVLQEQASADGGGWS